MKPVPPAPSLPTGKEVAGPAAAGRAVHRSLEAITRRQLGAATLGVAGPTLAACGVSGTGDQAGKPAAKLQGTVRIVWQDPTSFAGYKEVWESTFDAFQKANPNVKVEPNWITGDRREKILTAVAAGDPGELFWTNSSASIHEFSARKISRPLDEFVTRSKYDLGQHYTRAIELNRYQGKLHGLPKTTHPGIAAIFYNADAFQRQGVPVPAATWTYKELVETAIKLATPTPTFGFVGFQDGGRWLTPLYGFGADLLSKDGTASAAKGQATTDAFQWLEEIFRRRNVYPDPDTLSKQQGSIGMFTAGNVAMVPVGYWQIAAAAKAITGFTWKALPVPTGTGGRFSGYAASDNFAMFSSTKNPDAAWEYMRVWMQDEVMVKLVQIGFNPASKPAVNKHPSLQSLPYYDAVKVNAAQLESNKFDSVPTPANQLQSEVLAAGNKAVTTLYRGEASVRNVLDTLDQEIKQTLAKPLPS